MDSLELMQELRIFWKHLVDDEIPHLNETENSIRKKQIRMLIKELKAVQKEFNNDTLRSIEKRFRKIRDNEFHFIF